MAFDATPSAGPQAASEAIRALGGGMASACAPCPTCQTLQEQGL